MVTISKLILIRGICDTLITQLNICCPTRYSTKSRASAYSHLYPFKTVINLINLCRVVCVGSFMKMASPFRLKLDKGEVLLAAISAPLTFSWGRKNENII